MGPALRIERKPEYDRDQRQLWPNHQPVFRQRLPECPIIGTHQLLTKIASTFGRPSRSGHLGVIEQ